jgi:hypothetical protein
LTAAQIKLGLKAFNEVTVAVAVACVEEGKLFVDIFGANGRIRLAFVFKAASDSGDQG